MKYVVAIVALVLGLVEFLVRALLFPLMLLALAPGSDLTPWMTPYLWKFARDLTVPR